MAEAIVSEIGAIEASVAPKSTAIEVAAPEAAAIEITTPEAAPVEASSAEAAKTSASKAATTKSSAETTAPEPAKATSVGVGINHGECREANESHETKRAIHRRAFIS